MKINSVQTKNQYYKLDKNYNSSKDLQANNNIKFGSNRNIDKDTINYSVQNAINAAKEKNIAYKKLKDEEMLYRLYSGEDIGISESFLSNKNAMNELYQDPDFMKTSVSALLRATNDKLQDGSLSDEDFQGLLALNEFLTIQQDLFNDPNNSFETGLDDLSKERKADFKKAKKLGMFQEPQPAFGAIFNYGFFNKPKTRKRKAEAIVNRAATAAAAKSGALLFIGGKAELLKVITGVAEPIALTSTTGKMCSKICDTYQMSGAATTFLLSRLSGAIIGDKLAGAVLSFFSGVGNVANATITYTLHQVQGRIIIDWCEKNYKNEDVKMWDNIAIGVNVFRDLMRLVEIP